MDLLIFTTFSPSYFAETYNFVQNFIEHLLVSAESQLSFSQRPVEFMLLLEELWFGSITQWAAKKVTTVTSITSAPPTVTSAQNLCNYQRAFTSSASSLCHFIVIIPFYRFVVYCPRSQTYSLMDLEFQGLCLHSYFGLNSYFINSYFLSVLGTGPFQPTLLPLLLSAECFCSCYIQYHL